MLVGEGGQHDLEAYLAAAGAHPGRVRAILIREVPGLVPRDHRPDHARADALGVTLCVGEPAALAEVAAGQRLLT